MPGGARQPRELFFLARRLEVVAGEFRFSGDRRFPTSLCFLVFTECLERVTEIETGLGEFGIDGESLAVCLGGILEAFFLLKQESEIEIELGATITQLIELLLIVEGLPEIVHLDGESHQTAEDIGRLGLCG